MTRTMTLKRFTGAIALGALMLSLSAFMPLFASAHEGDARVNAANKAEIVITDGGKALVRGAKVTSVSGSTITAQTVFAGATATWTILTDSATSFYDARGKSGASSASIAVNDMISFAGAIEGGNIFNVRASAVKDWTPVASEATLKGTVSSVNTGNLSFVLTKKTGKESVRNVTVQLSSTTPITLNGSVSALLNLAVNDGIKVTGTLSADGAVLTATKVEATRPAPEEDKDFSRLIKHWFKGKGWLDVKFED